MNVFLKKLFDFLASLKLAVLLLAVFAALLSWATFYESSTSTAEAQRLVYKTAWFDLFLLVLGLNVFCSALIRYPWKKRLIGFVITHSGILIILFGAVITRQFGIEGRLAMLEGETADSILLDEIAFTVEIPRLNVRKEFVPNFIDTPIPEGKEIRYSLDDTGLACYIDQLVHASVPTIHARVEYQGKSADTYVGFNHPASIEVGGETVQLEFGNKRLPLNFSIHLIDFRAPRYPGTNRPQRFESEVKLIDPAANLEREQLIHMNNPLAYNKFVFFQSNYEEGTGGGPDKSVFSVAYAPGTSVIYFGSIVLVAGMLFMFFRKKEPSVIITAD